MAILTDDCDLRTVYFNMVKDDKNFYYIVLTEFPNRKGSTSSHFLRQVCFKEEENFSKLFKDLFEALEASKQNFFEEGSPDVNLLLNNYEERDAHLCMDLGGNGDYYAGIIEYYKPNGNAFISYRMSMSGGFARHFSDVKDSFVSLYRARQAAGLNEFPSGPSQQD